VAFGILEQFPPFATHRQRRVVAADGGDGRGQLSLSRGTPAAFSFGLFLGGGGGGATGHGADAMGDLCSRCLCEGVGHDGRRRRSSLHEPPPQHEAEAAAGMCRAATHPHFDATSVGGELLVWFSAILCYLPRPPPTNDLAALPPVVTTGVGACLGVVAVLLPLSWPLFGLKGCVDQ